MEFINCKASESSLRLYRHNLKKLNNNVEPVNYNFLKKTDDVMKLMPENKNTQRTAIISAVNACKGRKGFKKALEFYSKQMDLINAELKDSTAKSDRYKENEMSWENILEARDKLPKDSVENVYSRVQPTCTRILCQTFFCASRFFNICTVPPWFI